MSCSLAGIWQTFLFAQVFKAYNIFQIRYKANGIRATMKTARTNHSDIAHCITCKRTVALYCYVACTVCEYWECDAVSLVSDSWHFEGPWCHHHQGHAVHEGYLRQETCGNESRIARGGCGRGWCVPEDGGQCKITLPYLLQVGHQPIQLSSNCYHYTCTLPHTSHDSSSSHTAWTLNTKAQWSFETSGTTHPIRQCHICADLNLQPHCCENLKSDMWNVISKHCSVTVLSQQPSGPLQKQEYQIWHSVILCLMNISKSLQTEFVAAAHLEEGQFLKDGLTWNKGKSQRVWGGTQRLIMSVEEGWDLKPIKNVNNKNWIKLMSSLMQSA